MRPHVDSDSESGDSLASALAEIIDEGLEDPPPDPPPLPPPPVPPPPPPPPVPFRQPRSEDWGPWKIAKVVSNTPEGQVHVAWGATCGKHLNDDDRANTQCKKVMTMGRRFSSAEARHRMKAWLYSGLLINGALSTARTDHLRIHPPNIDLTMDEDALDQLAANLA